MAKQMKKKAFMPVLQGLIMFMIILIIMSTFYWGVVPVLKGESDKQLCKASVMAKYGQKEATLGIKEGSIALQCYTQTVTVKDDGIYKVGRKRKEVKIEDFKGLSGDPVDVLHQKINKTRSVIANEMYDCWDQFWQGKLPIWTKGKRCVICSEIIFEKDVFGIPGFKIGQYLNEAEIEKDVTYADFFDQKFDNGFAINTRVNTKIVFTSVAHSWWEKTKKVGGTGCAAFAATSAAGVALSGPFAVFTLPMAAVPTIGGCAVSAVAGGLYGVLSGSDWVPSLAVGPSGLVAEQCDRLY